jgi:beta-glucanase (GH16 family)
MRRLICVASLVLSTACGGSSADDVSSEVPDDTSDASSGGVGGSAGAAGAVTQSDGGKPDEQAGGTQHTDAAGAPPDVASDGAVAFMDDIRPAKGGRFVPIWHDEFDGPVVDANKWYVDDQWPSMDLPWRRNWKPANVSIESGALVIQTVSDGTNYSTGAIETGKFGGPNIFEQAFGRFEARMRFQAQQGHWTAFWLMNPNEGNVDGSGRDGSEIDILEKAWLGDRANHAIHWDGYGASQKSAGQQSTGYGLDDGGWHTSALEWTPDQYVFSIDDNVAFTSSAGGVCQTPNWILLTDEIGNYGTGPDVWGTGSIQGATLPDRFYVDYVRVWKFEAVP